VAFLFSHYACEQENIMQQTANLEILAGTHYEIGVQHGRRNAAQMRTLLGDFHVDLDAPWREEEFLEPLERHLPGLVEEINGIAAGSVMSLRAVVALSFLIDLGTASSACTGVVFADGPDGPVVAKTCDCSPGTQQEWLNQRLVRPVGEYAAVIHSHIGSPNAEMGMNEKGLAIGISGLLSNRIDREGVGWQQDIRGILHRCATTAEAIDMFRAVPIRHAGYAAVVGDAGGNVAVVERLVGTVAVRRPAGKVVFEANIALSEEAQPFVSPAWGGDNGRGRTALLARLCADETTLDFSLQGMLNLFSIHDNPGLCQHGPELHSHTGFFMLPRKRELWIARGYTCERNLEVFQF